ncbi:MAG: glutathione S-transferase N-terminal domain-containing protein [Henriciella sp.]|nr:glutathione S-transferase N-terminal domain-containing protein [Henriciella sp.]
MGHIMYGSEMSLFSGKARAYLRWKGVEFTEIAPTPAIMKSEIIANIGWPVVPVIKLDTGAYVQDTADIIDVFERRDSTRPVMPGAPVQNFVSYLIQLFADEWLTLPAMHYRWNHNEEWIYTQFGANAAPDASPEEQYEAGKQVGARFHGFVPMLGVTDATIPGIEQAYEQFLADFSTHLEIYPYVFGHRASFADFGLIGPLYAHQYRDKYSGELMKRVAPRVANWVERVIAGDGKDGDLIPDDAIPETLLPILKVQMAEQIPALSATNDLFGTWAETAEPLSEVPRGFDMIPFTTGGHSGQCAARSFPLYRLQDALDAYALLHPDDKARADALLDEIGGGALKTFKLKARLTRRNYKLALA